MLKTSLIKAIIILMNWLWNTLEIILLIVLPFLWGLGVEHFFEWYRHKKSSHNKIMNND